MHSSLISLAQRGSMLLLAVFCWLSTVCPSIAQPAFSAAAPNGIDTWAHVSTTAPKQAVGKRGAVVSAHPEASKVGLSILKAGGNAFDAAIGVELALAVCFPVAGNVGGGGFGIYHTAAGQTYSIDYRERAPAAITPNHYLDAQGNVRDSLLKQGALSAGVPGTLQGMEQLHKKLGRMPWQKLVQPAVQLAERGFALTQIDADLLNRFAKKFKEVNPGAVPFIKASGQPWQKGDTLKQPALARTLKAVQMQGAKAVYTGPVAEKLASFVQQQGGLITTSDLKNYTAQWRAPHDFNWNGYRISSMGPPSSGGLILNQILGMISLPDATQRMKQTGPTSLFYAQQFIEAERMAYADRSAYMGDPDYVKVPVAAMVNPSYLRSRFPDWHYGAASKSADVKPGLGAYDPQKGLVKESTETTHYTVADGAGNVVSSTTTLNGPFGSGVVDPNSGILLNNEMDDFSVKPGVPNAYGLVGSAANAIAPGKRMLSSMSPTVVCQKGKDGKWRAVATAGTPGGSTIPTTTLQVLLRILLFAQAPHTAVAAPRFHHQWLPDDVKLEQDALPAEVQQQLKNLGYVLKPIDMIGRAEALKRAADGTWQAGADPRGDDTALSW